jgi:FlaG protein
MESPAASPLSAPALVGGVSSAAHRPSDAKAARVAGEDTNQPDVVNLFERARQALLLQLHRAPAVGDVLAVPSLTTSPMAREAAAPVAVHLVMNDRTQGVVVHVIDARTGAVLRAMPSTALAAVAARIGRSVGGSSAKAMMR